MKILTSKIYKMYSNYQDSLNILLAEKCNNSKEIIVNFTIKLLKILTFAKSLKKREDRTLETV